MLTNQRQINGQYALESMRGTEALRRGLFPEQEKPAQRPANTGEVIAMLAEGLESTMLRVLKSIKNEALGITDESAEALHNTMDQRLAPIENNVMIMQGQIQALTTNMTKILEIMQSMQQPQPEEKTLKVKPEITRARIVERKFRTKKAQPEVTWMKPDEPTVAPEPVQRRRGRKPKDTGPQEPKRGYMRWGKSVAERQATLALVLKEAYATHGEMVWNNLYLKKMKGQGYGTATTEYTNILPGKTWREVVEWALKQ